MFITTIDGFFVDCDENYFDAIIKVHQRLDNHKESEIKILSHPEEHVVLLARAGKIIECWDMPFPMKISSEGHLIEYETKNMKEARHLKECLNKAFGTAKITYTETKEI